jgi:hypothetical protein
MDYLGMERAAAFYLPCRSIQEMAKSKEKKASLVCRDRTVYGRMRMKPFLQHIHQP